MNKAKLNYWVDIIIGLAFLLSAASGLAFLAPALLVGQSIAGMPVFLWIPYATWDRLHTFSSLAMIVGVFLHLVLHWQWIVTMTRKMFQSQPRPVARPAPAGNPFSRREFLAACGGVAVTALCGGLWLRRNPRQDASGMPEAFVPTATSQAQSIASPTTAPIISSTPLPTLTATPTPIPTPTPLSTLVATRCPRGLVNDPYPGRCRLYTDANKNGICDYSEI